MFRKHVFANGWYEKAYIMQYIYIVFKLSRLYRLNTESALNIYDDVLHETVCFWKFLYCKHIRHVCALSKSSGFLWCTHSKASVGHKQRCLKKNIVWNSTKCFISVSRSENKLSAEYSGDTKCGCRICYVYTWWDTFTCWL